MVYLDHAATTPLHPEVIKVMSETMQTFLAIHQAFIIMVEMPTPIRIGSSSDRSAARGQGT